MRMSLQSSFVVIMMDTILPGTWSTSFPKSAIRGGQGQPVGPQQKPKEGLDDLEGSSKALCCCSPSSALLGSNAHGKEQMCIEKENCVVEKKRVVTLESCRELC